MRIPFIVVAGALVLGTSTQGACKQAEFKGADAEVKETEVKLDMPKIPDFSLPKGDGDTKTIKEMRLLGGSLLKTEVKIKGFITWIYNCGEAEGSGLTPKQVKKMLADHPEKCDRPSFRMGDAADTPSEKGVWVVAVPRELRKDEKKGYSRKELKALPPVPVIALGDEVTVTGKWAQSSLTGFTRTEGLLVYGSLESHTNPEQKKPKKKRR